MTSPRVVIGRARGLRDSLLAAAAHLGLARDSCARLPTPEQAPEGQL